MGQGTLQAYVDQLGDMIEVLSAGAVKLKEAED